MRTRGNEYRIENGDLYPDAISCLIELRRFGLVVGIAGNEPAETEVDLRKLELPVDHIATSTGVGVAKPDPAFFKALRDLVGVPADQIAYVGDRLDNDLLPAQAAGMVGVLIERGPWGLAHAMRPEERQAHLLVHSLETLPRALREIGAL